MKPVVTIVTHSSKFHTDDIFAVATLMLFLEKENPNAEVKVVRTRERGIIDSGDYVVDVGGEYDPARNRFDHHQKNRPGARKNGIYFASFGLVWKKYGEVLCGSSEVSKKIDEVLVQPIDAHDNGMTLVEPKIEGVYPYDIGSLFSSFNPSWKEGMEQVDKMFLEAVSYAKKILTREIIRTKDKEEARAKVEEVYAASEDKRLIIFDRFYPADEFLNQFPEPLFFVFPREDGTWVLDTIRDNPEVFIDRKSLPRVWAGKRDEELEEVTGVKGAIFCHNDCFIAGASTKEAILKMAEIALNS